MPRVLLLCFTIVAAFQTELAAAPPIVQVPVTPSVASLAERVGMDVARDRARFVSELVRRIYSPPASRQPALNLIATAHETLGPAPQTTVDVPLSPALWSEVVFKRPVAADQLLANILLDRHAALLCRGLLAADDETLEYFAARPALLLFLRDHAPAFAAFADSFHVRGGRLEIAGGASAVPLWQALIRVNPTDPDAFLRTVLFEPEARLAYLFDVLNTASPESRAFALGLWIADDAVRVQRFMALGTMVRGSYREWHVDEMPFARPLNDLAILLLRIVVDPHGEPKKPAHRQFWATALDASANPESAVALPASHTLIDAAWLLQGTSGDMYERGDRLDQFAFGQRVFANRADSELEAAAAVIREMPTRRMLLLGLERIGVTDPKVYAAGLRQAHDALDGGADRFWTVAQQQSALAMIVHMSVNGSISSEQASTLAGSLLSLPISTGEFHGQLADWFQEALAVRLPDGPSWEARTIAGLAGGPTPGRPEVEWEGQTYRVDLAFAERRRMEAIRQRQGGPDLDTAFALTHLARRTAQATSLDAVRPLIAEAQTLLASSGASLARPPVNPLPVGVPVPRDGREWLTRAVEDMDRAVHMGDLRRATRAGESLVTLSDIAVGHALMSMVYAIHLGDPEGPALLGTNVALRHDFGFSRRDGAGRSRGPWALPRQDFQPGVPWHVFGAIVGLDIALAPMGLHRLSIDGLATPPRLQSIEREAFGVNVALLNPRRLRDIDRDRIVAAISSGRQRVRALKADTAEFDRARAEIALDGWRTRALRWVLQNQPDLVENQLSLAELLVLGEPDSSFDAWGTSGLLSMGCLCSRFPTPRTWRIVAGRTQMAMMAATTVEMQLEFAQRFAALRLPAVLLPSVLQTAMQDFIDRVDSADPNDRMALILYPRRISRTDLEDYVAATATLDGPLVSGNASDGTEP
jgi:hypothetical protein